ncbi:MAG: gamma-glutamyl-gamma-aminobutyrate hydrolase family protein [Christensenellaceae bacterium]|jgi:putative glutamine amidotransferase
MEKTPIIGLTAYYKDAPPKGHYMVGHDYVYSVAQSGGCPILLPITDEEKILERYAAQIDGLILIGGGDVDPTLYGEAPSPLLGGVDLSLDVYEIALIKHVARLKKPIFGICRGMQVLNVAYGGTLIQDIPSQVEHALVHAGDMQKRSTPIHDILVEKEGCLWDMMKRERIGVNSFHHQAVKQLAEEFQVTAYAEDGIVEAMEHKTENIYGVQFHPENMSMTDSKMKALFDTFINLCR